ncbi:MAG: ThuA domain-containing protein [Pirellulales bacterium]
MKSSTLAPVRSAFSCPTDAVQTSFSFRSLRSLLIASALLGHFGVRAMAAEPPKPLKVLLIAGGCCHEYDKQTAILKTGLEARAHVMVEIDYNPDRTTRARFARYEQADWADAYDVIIHDECTSDVKEMPYVQRILDAHRRGKPAVNLHCAMHCYRTGTDDWFKFLGLHSTGHGPQKPIAVKHVDKEHPITKTLQDWTTVNEELYNNVRLFDTARPLARGIQDTGKKVDDYVVTWVNEYGSTRVFCTTLGHNTATVSDPKYLELVTRGLLWSCDKLNDQYLKPTPAATPAAEGPQPTPAKRP